MIQSANKAFKIDAEKMLLTLSTTYGFVTDLDYLLDETGPDWDNSPYQTTRLEIQYQLTDLLTTRYIT